MISYIDIKDGNIKGILACTGGNMMIEKIKNIINDDIKEIIFCFDNDEQGKKFIEKIKYNLKGYNLIYKISISINKDWNDDLKNLKYNEIKKF